jgi:serine phosphatase RsbU (regulator of sigma subunit)/anti-sigma regulatory factor (Ser/Thr protein kinase)
VQCWRSIENTRIASRGRAREADALTLVVVAGGYYVAAQLGLQLAVVGNDVTPLWPPTGVAVVALLAFGRRVWPAVAIAAFAVNAPISPHLGAALLITIGNTIAPLVAAFLLGRVEFRPQLTRVHDALALVFLGALASMLISASIGAFTLLLSNDIDRRDFFETWSVWWAGDAMGVLIVAPFLWSLRVPDLRAIRWDRVVEAVALFAVLVVTCVLSVRGPDGTLVLVLPVLGWIAWRFQLSGAAPAALLASVIVTTAAADDMGPFADESLATQMILLQSFNASVAFMCVLFASAVAERQQLVEREQDAQRELYQREHRVAGTLQRSLMTERLPQPAGLAVASRYLPASTEATIGGDWYDIIALEGRIGLVIGDVAGHGVSAAATMGQLRMALRAYALDGLPPAVALDRLNRLMRELQPGAMATVLYGHLDSESRNLCFASAGHPPPLLILGPHDARYLEDGRAPPLGVTSRVSFAQATTWIQPGATLVLYTDGLVERRRASIDDRFRLLRRVAGEAPDDLEASCDHLLAQLLDEGGPTDDVALLAVRPLALAGARLFLRHPAVTDTVVPTRRAIAHWLHENGVNREIAFNMIVAATEAYTNAVLHAYGAAEGTVEVEGTVGSGAVRMTVRDAGSWKPAPEAHDGCGLMMMRALTSVDLHTSECGTEVSLQCDLGVASKRG